MRERRARERRRARTERRTPARRAHGGARTTSTPAANGAHAAPASAPAQAAPVAVSAQTPRLARLAALRAGARRWLAGRDLSFWLLIGVTLLALLPRLYNLDWDANNHLHPDEREIVFKAMCLSLPNTPRVATCDPAYSGSGWLLSPHSPLNPHFFAYGSFPLYLLAAVAHGLAWLARLTGGRFLAAPDLGTGLRPTWDDFDHFTLIGRALSALFDSGSVVLAGLLTRRLLGARGRWVALLAAAFVATTAFQAQVSHFYAVDTLLLFFVLLTLYACLALAQGPRNTPAPRPAAAEGEKPERAAYSIWGSWGAGVFVGASCALAVATKVSAAPLLAPIAVALALRWRRRGLEEAFFALVGAVSAGILVFALVSPYALIDWQNFQQQINEQNALSRGQLDYPYVRQFAGTTPFVYQLRQLVLYDMGPPLGLLGLAGFGWAVARVWRRLDDDWSILVVWTAAYFLVVGSAYMKFTRYMLPVFAPLSICAAALLGAWWVRLNAPPRAQPRGAGGVALGGVALRRVQRWLAREGGRSWLRWACLAVGALTLASSLLLTLALTNVYSAPNTRVQASEWLYDHVRPGASITYEIWDDALPIQAPAAGHNAAGAPLTAGGALINPGEYTVIGLDLYAEDTPEKAATLAQQLSVADVVVISSQRLLRSIPKLPDRYPMTTRYYQRLFAGELGFTLAAHFEHHPHLGPFTLDDTGADESYSVYDHPPVWIFTRSGAGLTADQLRARLTDGVTLPATSQRSGAQKSLLLAPARVAANQATPSLGAQFPAGSLANRIPLVWWLLALELLGLVSFPLAWRVFPGLADRGWGLSKLLGLLLLAYVVWLPANLAWLPFERGVVIAFFALLVAGGGALLWRDRARLAAFARAHWRVLVAGELAFLLAFVAFAYIRALDPDLWHIYRGGEKPMELAYLDAILRSRYLPPYDPWFSGGVINYYYYGQYLIAVLIKLTGVAPATAFNLAIPTLCGLTVSGAFSVVAGLTRRWWAGLLAGLGLCFLGNLDGAAQVIGQWQARLASVAPPPFDYWRSSRVIPFTINEFPFWSFLYADLHAHLIDLPITVFLIACCASLLATARADGGRIRPALPTLAAVALALGAAWCTNTWDVPTYAALVVLAFALRLLPFGPEGGGWGAWRARLTWPRVRASGLALAVTFAATYALYLPFHQQFQSFSTGTGTVVTHTDVGQWLTIFGLWIFLTASYFAVELRDRVAALFGVADAREGTGATVRAVTLAFFAGALVIALLGGVKALLIVLIFVGVFLALDPRQTPLKLFTYLLLLLGLIVALGVEFVYVRDFLDNSDYERMNTVFKFQYQVWTLLALGGALAVSQLLLRLFAPAPAAGPSAEDEAGAGPADSPQQDQVTEPPVWTIPAFAGEALRALWLLALVALVAGASVFAFAGTQARVSDPAVWAGVQPPPAGVQPQGLSLDGAAFMQGWYPGDAEAIPWLNERVAGSPTIVEASADVYHWHGRVSVYTGLPDVVQLGHESEQRYPAQVAARQQDVTIFWATDDPDAALAFLRAYDVRYVYLGDLERTCYTLQNGNCVALPAGGLAKFQALAERGALRVVHQNPQVTIYEVAG